MADSPFMLRPAARAAPPGFPPDVAPNQIIYAAHINAIRDSVAVWPGNVDGNGKNLSGVAAITVTGAITGGSLETALLRSAPDMVVQVGAGYPERMRITAAGQMAIGSNNPAGEAAIAKLVVTGAASQTAGSLAESNTKALVSFRANASSGYALGIGAIAADSSPYIQGVNFGGGGASTNLLLNPFGGSVGIGIQAPGSQLHIADVSGSPGVAQAVVTLSRAWFSASETRASAVFHYYSGGDMLAFGVAGDGGTNAAPGQVSQIKMVITAGGRVGIGTAAPGAKLDVRGTMAADLPSSNPGAGTKQFWYDPADSNRVKFAA